MNSSHDPEGASTLKDLINWYQTLTPASLQQIDKYYTQDAWFKDPFNEVSTREHIAEIFHHMFTTLDNPRFVIQQHIGNASQTFIVWHMEFFLNDRAVFIKGCSHLHHNAAGLVTHHRDYWDAAEELYEKLPILGWLMKFIKRKMKTPLPLINTKKVTTTTTFPER